MLFMWIMIGLVIGLLVGVIAGFMAGVHSVRLKFNDEIRSGYTTIGKIAYRINKIDGN